MLTAHMRRPIKIIAATLSLTLLIVLGNWRHLIADQLACELLVILFACACWALFSSRLRRYAYKLMTTAGLMFFVWILGGVRMANLGEIFAVIAALIAIFIAFELCCFLLFGLPRIVAYTRHQDKIYQAAAQAAANLPVIEAFGDAERARLASLFRQAAERTVTEDEFMTEFERYVKALDDKWLDVIGDAGCSYWSYDHCFNLFFRRAKPDPHEIAKGVESMRVVAEALEDQWPLERLKDKLDEIIVR